MNKLTTADNISLKQNSRKKYDKNLEDNWQLWYEIKLQDSIFMKTPKKLEFVEFDDD
jgi:hypothetical protein